MSELEIWTELGNIYYKSGAVDEAIRTYQKAIELNPASGQPYGNLAAIFVSQGRYREAIPLYQKGIELIDDPTNRAFLWNQLANDYRKLGDYPNARACYTKAIELSPRDNTFRKNLAEVELASRPFSLEPTTGIIQVKLAPAREGIPEKRKPETDGKAGSEPENTRQVAEQNKPVSQVEEISAVAPEPHVNTPGSRIIPDKPDGAEKADTPNIKERQSLDLADEMESVGHADGLETIDANSHGLLRLGIIHWRNAEYEKALNFLKIAQDIGTRSKNRFQEAFSNFIIAQVEVDLGRIEEGIQAYQRAANLAPKKIFPWNKLGDLNCMLNHFDEAQEAFKEAIEHNPKDPVSWNGLGDVYHKLGLFEDAIAAYQLGNVFENRNLDEDVLIEFEKTIDSNQENPRIWYEAGNIYYSTGAYTDAIASYQKAIELDPVNVTFQASLAIAEQALEEANPRSEQPVPEFSADAGPETLPRIETFTEEKTTLETEAANVNQTDSTKTGQEQEPGVVPEPISNETIGIADPEPEHAYWLFKSNPKHIETEQSVKKPLPVAAEKVINSIKPIPAFGFKLPHDKVFSGDREKTDPVREDARILVQLTPRPSVPARPAGTILLPVPEHTLENVPSEPEAGLQTPAPVAEVRTAEPVPNASGTGSPPADQPERDRQVLENDIASYRRVIEINPENDRAWDTLGNVYENAGLHGEAAAAFEQAVNLKPEKEVYHYHLGIALGYKMEYEKAIQSLEKVVALNPRYMLAHCALAGYYRRIDKESEAREHAQIARPSMQDENEYNQACFESISGDADRAIALLGIALEKKQIQPVLVRSDPDLDFIRKDARFEELLIKNKIISQ